MKPPLRLCGLLLSLSCAQLNAQNFAPEPVFLQPGHSGSWTDTGHRGQGFDLQIIGPDRAVGSWQTATPEGQSLWLYGDGLVRSDTIEFTFYQVDGGRFPGAPGATEPRTRAWGTASFKISGCSNASLTWRPASTGFPAGASNFSRITSPAGVACHETGGIFQDTDLGAPPVAAPATPEGQRAVVLGGEVLLATGDGLWRRRIDGSRPWYRNGLDGLDVAFVIADSSSKGRLFAGGQPAVAGKPAFFTSFDSGQSWSPAQSSPLDADGRQEGFVDVVVSPRNSDLLFAGLAGGQGIAYSVDGGRNWERVNGQRESLFGYSCHLAVLPDAPDRLFQGCEAPLDSASLWVYELTARALGEIGEPRTLAGLAQIGNRRPQRLLHSPARPGWLYAGLEGALVAVNEQGKLEYLYRAEEGGETPYIYVSAIWIDPANPRHLIFGGGLNGPNGQLTLFETFDHGLTRSQLQVPAGLRNPIAQSVLTLDPHGDRLLVVVNESDADFGNRSTRVIELQRTIVPTAIGGPIIRIRVGTGSRD